jgi:GST-like protein
MIELFGMSSPNVRKVVIALEEMGLDFRARHVPVFRGEQFGAEFLAVNPLAKVPAILDPDGPAGDMPVFESGAILIYLAENYGVEFLPLDGAARYEVLKWLVLQVANVGPALGQHSHFRLQAKGNEYAARRFRHMAAQIYRVLEARLAETEWLGGCAYSIADMAAYPWARYLERHGMEREEFPRLIAWRELIDARPAVIRADKVMRDYGEKDRADRQAQTPEELERFLGLHIPAPSEQAAAAIRTKTERI